MKRNLLKIGAAAVCLLLALDATGGTLAKAERVNPESDRFVGFHLVYERMPQPGEFIQEDRTHWTEYGSEAVQVEGFGTLSLPRQILIGQYDEENMRYEFPGLEGFNCFLAEAELEGGGIHYTGYTDMTDVKTKVGDVESSISGTVYFGPPLNDRNWNTEYPDYMWTAYRVYQMEDGTIYLDGTGNSYGGVGGFTASSKEEYTTTVNGEATTKSMEAEFSIQSVERLTSVAVKWFGAEDQILLKRTLTPEEIGDGLTLDVPEGALWVLVKETNQTGAVTRSVYTLGEKAGVSHRLILLDEGGLGTMVPLILEEEATL